MREKFRFMILLVVLSFPVIKFFFFPNFLSQKKASSQWEISPGKTAEPSPYPEKPLFLGKSCDFGQNKKNAPAPPYVQNLSINPQLAFRRLMYRVNPSVNLLVIHENETDARQTMEWALKTYGGVGYEVLNLARPKQRELRYGKGIRSFLYDPNRIFTDSGIQGTLLHYTPLTQKRNRTRNFQKQAFKALKKKIQPALLKLIHLHPETYLIALHNTAPKTRYSAKDYLNKPLYEVYLNPAHPAKNFVLVTRKKEFTLLRESGINTVWQKSVDLKKNDGSLSAYAGLKKMAYLCIETQFRNQEEQKQILKIVLERIVYGKRVRNSPGS